jgi:hypothetical protein
MRWIKRMFSMLFDRSKKSNEEDVMIQKTAAFEIGMAIGIKLALIGLPVPLRVRPFSGLIYDDGDLMRLFKDTGVDSNEVANFISDTGSGFRDHNPINGSNKMMGALNRLRSKLRANGRLDLASAMRIGWTVGTTMEQTFIFKDGNPKQLQEQWPKLANIFVGLSQTWRQNMQEDMVIAEMPSRIDASIRETNVEVNSIADLDRIATRCQVVVNEVRSLQEKG